MVTKDEKQRLWSKGKIILKCIKRLILKMLGSTHIKKIYKELIPIAWLPLKL